MKKESTLIFKEKLVLEFSPFGYAYKIVTDNGQIITLKGEEAPTAISGLIDKYAWWKIDISTSMERDDFSWSSEPIPEEHKYDFSSETTIRILLKKEKRVKSFQDRQPIPAGLFKILPKEVRKELQATKKQIWYIESLLEDVSFSISEKELSLLTKREASALIEHLQTLPKMTEEPVSF